MYLGIVDRHIDARMNSGIDSSAFILSVFIEEILNNLCTIGPLNNPAFILSVFIEEILNNLCTVGPYIVLLLCCQYLLKKS